MAQWLRSLLTRALPGWIPESAPSQPLESTIQPLESNIEPLESNTQENAGWPEDTKNNTEEGEITELITYLQRRYLPGKVARDLCKYLLERLKDSSLEPENRATLVKIHRGLAWKARIESSYIGESYQMAAGVWADKSKATDPEIDCGKTTKELREELMASIRDAVEKEKVEMPTTPLYSYMGTYFKKAPHIKAFLTPSRWALVQKVFRQVEEDAGPFPRNIFELRTLIKHLEKVTKTNKIKEWETRVRNHKRKTVRSDCCELLDKKDTYTAVYEKLPLKERKQLHPGLQEVTRYQEAVEIMGILRGRYRNYYSSGVRSMCARLDKIGFLQYNVTEEQLQQDLPTAIFLCMMVAEFSVRKEFTLDSQQQGALLPFLEWYMEDILKKSSTTRWDLIAQLYPADWILAPNKCPRRVVQKLYNDWLLAVDIMMPFILEQWANGVETRVSVGMAVPSSRSNLDIDSEGWNIVIGAWNNAVRQIRMCATRLEIDPPEIFKCMKLIAHDQMMWADSEGKGVHVDTEVFKSLIDEEVMPWDGFNRTGIREKVAAVCERHGARFAAWFGKPQERRSGLEKSHGDMICGIKVPVDKPTADALKALGLYKSKPAHVSKAVEFEDQPVGGFDSSQETQQTTRSSQSSHKSSLDTVLLEESDGDESAATKQKPIKLKKDLDVFLEPSSQGTTTSSSTVVLQSTSEESVGSASDSDNNDNEDSPGKRRKSPRLMASTKKNKP